MDRFDSGFSIIDNIEVFDNGLTGEELETIKKIFDRNPVPVALLRVEKGKYNCIYRNRKMEEIYDVFADISEDLAKNLEDAALKEKSYTLSRYSVAKDKHLEVFLYPYKKGYCGCMLNDVTDFQSEQIRTKEYLRAQMERQTKYYWQTIDLMSALIEHRSNESGVHVAKIKYYTRCLLENLANMYPDLKIDRDDIEDIVKLSPLHDIGKIGIPDCILLKPGKLSMEEFEVMKKHTVIGAQISRSLPYVDNDRRRVYAYEICKYHHERFDGKGYPEGLSGREIPLCAQVVGLADAYEALTSKRVYKEAYSHEKSMKMLVNGECGTFSQRLIKCLMKVSEQFEAIRSHF
ncbi:MAG: HD domain-containing protein [Bacillota bacterium]|nr:HD domain-containing protein [Bacillota bacterium]